MGSNSISGKENRAAGRDFNEETVNVDQLIGRDFVSISLSGSKDTESEPLVPAQRKQLNQLAKELSEASNEEGYIVWQRVHAEVGVKSINEITKEQYPAAVEYLQKELDKLRNTSACKALMHQLLKKTSDEEQRQCLYQYCDISFGNRHLAELSKEQLQQALGWIYNEQSGVDKVTLDSPEHLSLLDLLRAYPKELGFIFLIGGLVGAVLF